MMLPASTDPEQWTRTLRAISEHCPKLSEIDFGPVFPIAGENSAYMAFLQHYGNQLMRAPYGEISLEDLRFFVKTCPNVRCSWSFWCEPDVERFSTLAPLLREVSFDMDTVVVSDKGEVLSLCKLLAKLYIEGPMIYDFPRILGLSVFSELKKLQLIKMVTSQVLVRLILHQFPSLSMLDCETTDLFPTADVFRSIVGKLHGVTFVRIVEDFTLTDTKVTSTARRYIDIGKGIIDTFSQVPHLEQFIMGTRSAFCDVAIYRTMVRHLLLRNVSCTLLMSDGSSFIESAFMDH